MGALLTRPFVVERKSATGSGDVSLSFDGVPEAGELLLFWHRAGLVETVTPPGGVTLEEEVSDDSVPPLRLYSRIAVAGESNSYTWTGGGIPLLTGVRIARHGGIADIRTSTTGSSASASNRSINMGEVGRGEMLAAGVATWADVTLNPSFSDSLDAVDKYVNSDIGVASLITGWRELNLPDPVSSYTVGIGWGSFTRARMIAVRIAESPATYEVTPEEIAEALVTSPVNVDFRFEKVTKSGQFLADVTEALIGGAHDGNNDREVFAKASFRIDASLGLIDPLADHIRVTALLLVNGVWEEFPRGIYALGFPRKTYRPTHEEWEVEAFDLSLHLVNATTTGTYTVAASTNYMAAAKTILDNAGLASALPNSSKTLPADLTWPPGTAWLKVVNDLLREAGFYGMWFDPSGVARTRALDSLSQRTPDVEYVAGDGFVLSEIGEEAETTRFANQVVAYRDDPDLPAVSSTATNDDPASPTSTVALGRTITKTVRMDAADQTTLDNRAQYELEQSGSYYRRATLTTPFDPRRWAREVYGVTVGDYLDGTWWCRNWSVALETGAVMTHTIARVQRIGGGISE